MNTQISMLPRMLPLALLLAGAGLSPGAITYVNPVDDIVIPNGFGGVYLDLDAVDPATPVNPGSPVIEPNSYTVSYSQPASGDWDVNFFFGGAGVYHNTTFQPYRADDTDNLSAVHQVGLNTEIDGDPLSLPGPESSSPLETATWGGSGSGSGDGSGANLPSSGTHMGTGTNQFQSGTADYIAFVLNPGTASEQFGWMEVTLNDDGTAGSINSWAYSPDPILVGQIPEPGSVVLLALGSLALLRRKR